MTALLMLCASLWADPCDHFFAKLGPGAGARAMALRDHFAWRVDDHELTGVRTGGLVKFALTFVARGGEIDLTLTADARGFEAWVRLADAFGKIQAERYFPVRWTDDDELGNLRALFNARSGPGEASVADGLSIAADLIADEARPARLGRN